MLNKAHISFLVPDRTYLPSVKREIERILERNGFSVPEIGRINIIVSELVTNLGKHAIQGQEILVKLLGDKSVKGIEILSLDNAPGMKNPLRMLEDGVSTSGTFGQGLGAIKRLSDEFDIYSEAEKGTIVLSRFYKKGFKKIPDNKCPEFTSVIVPLKGETECGDGWSIKHYRGRCIILALDGLGHGPDAQAAAQKAINVFQCCDEEMPNDIMKKIHSEISKTRGAVGCVASIDMREGKLLYCGLGNIAGRIISNGDSRSLISYSGILGHNMPNTFQNHPFDWDEHKLLVLHSDGIKAKWDFIRYTNWQRYDTSLIAASIYKDNTRRTDDSMVIVGRTKRL
jgi:anti-sigma regulatory factor (Ser/Thr protein kinase)